MFIVRGGIEKRETTDIYVYTHWSNNVRDNYRQNGGSRNNNSISQHSRYRVNPLKDSRVLPIKKYSGLGETVNEFFTRAGFARRRVR